MNEVVCVCSMPVQGLQRLKMNLANERNGLCLQHAGSIRLFLELRVSKKPNPRRVQTVNANDNTKQ